MLGGYPPARLYVSHSADDFCETRAVLSLRLSMYRQSTCQVTWQVDCLCLGNQRVTAVWVYSLLLVFDVGNFSQPYFQMCETVVIYLYIIIDNI